MARTGRPPEPIIHGTVGGYYKEYRRDIPRCGACAEAWRLYYRDRDRYRELVAEHGSVRAREDDR